MLNLTNYFDHPGDNRYTVFRFTVSEHADHFESLLRTDEIEYERHEELDEEGSNLYLFGVSKRFQKNAVRANFLTHAAYRKPFIGNKLLKYALLVITIGFVVLAILGYINQNAAH